MTVVGQNELDDIRPNVEQMVARLTIRRLPNMSERIGGRCECRAGCRRMRLRRCCEGGLLR